MFKNLTIAEWLGPTRHPPHSLIRPILDLIDLRGLRPFVLHHFRTEAMESSTRNRVPGFFFVIDETCLASSHMPNIWNHSPPRLSPSMISAMRWSIGFFKPGAFIFAQLCSTSRLRIDMDKATLCMVNILSSRSWAPTILCGFVVVINMAIFPSQFHLFAHVYYALLVGTLLHPTPPHPT